MSTAQRVLAVVAIVVGLQILGCMGCVMLIALVPDSPTPVAQAEPEDAEEPETEPEPSEPKKKPWWKRDKLEGPEPTEETPEPAMLEQETAQAAREDSPPVTGNTPHEETRQLRESIAKAIGTDGLSFTINDHFEEPAWKLIQVRFEVGDNLTENMIRNGAKVDIQRILKAVHESGIPCFEVTVLGSYPLADNLGNETKEVVTKATYSGQTIARINWSNFLFDNVYEVADSHWLHPAFRN